MSGAVFCPMGFRIQSCEHASSTLILLIQRPFCAKFPLSLVGHRWIGPRRNAEDDVRPSHNQRDSRAFANICGQLPVAV